MQLTELHEDAGWVFDAASIFDQSDICCAPQVRLAELPEGASSVGVSTSLLGQHGGRAHKLALDPLNPSYCFYSCGEDGQVCTIAFITLVLIGVWIG